MAIYGYTRTSTKEQHLDRGIKRIEDFCAQQNLDLVEIYTDQQTGKNFNRPEYQFIKKRMLPDDILIVPEVDRLGRNKEGILRELQGFKARQIRIMILEIPTTLIDLRNLDDNLGKMLMETITNMLIEMYATFAEAEMHKKEQRQREGYERVRRDGEWDKLGRPCAITMDAFVQEYRKVKAGRLTPKECMSLLGLAPATYYRYRKAYEATGQSLIPALPPAHPGPP